MAELRDIIQRRHMVRDFAARHVPDALIVELVDLARRAPSAGNTQAVKFVLLNEPTLVDRYWNTTMNAEKRSDFRWQGLLKAPALILLTTEPEAYLRRYSEPDKRRTGRGSGVGRWPVPYWWVDAGAVAQNLLLLCSEAGLGACLFGPFDHEPALIEEFDLDPLSRIVATIATGYPKDPSNPNTDSLGRSATRERPSIADILIRPM